jgi:small subunit ribosomal protein S24e
MEIRFLEERANPLLSRKEYLVEISHPQGPSPKREDVRKELSEMLKVPRDRLVVEWMRARYGASRSRGLVHAYEAPQALARTVREHIQVRNGLKAKAEKGAKAAPSAEAPAEKKEG